MKTFWKLVVILILVILLTITSCVLLINQSMKMGIIVGIVLFVLNGLIFLVSIYGVVSGKIIKWKLYNRIEVGGLLLGTVFLALFIFLFTITNTAMEETLENPTISEKTRLILNLFTYQSTQKDVVKEKRQGITYVFHPENRVTVDRFEALLLEKKSSMDAIFGNELKDHLTIEIYNDPTSLQANSYLNDVTGYYDYFNKSINVLKIDLNSNDNWKQNLLHEYTHYRIQQFSKMNHLDQNSEQVPLWFNEGVCVLIGYQNERISNVTELIDIADFHLLDSIDSFHAARENYNPYLQSYFAVKALVNDYGEAIIPKLLLSKTEDDFYKNLEKLTGMSLNEFQQTFLKKLQLKEEEISEKFALVSSAILEHRYNEVEKLITEIKNEGFKEDIEYANSLLVQIYLEQCLYENAINLLNIEIQDKENRMYLANIMQLAEIYLLFDTEKALKYSEIVEVEAKKAPVYNKELAVNFAEALRLINSSNPVPGYKRLLEVQQIFNEPIRNELINKLQEEYPGQF
ncbi:peptidase MA family metallohydrolase [Psychrobacillus sp. L3]|uniref:peptidase MA family metallohydrolase n=1 Tax=Psychrobacillus sp. L3 TaxID=3236891 RepID=UPI0036F34A6B